jgi:hypothetical protein
MSISIFGTRNPLDKVYNFWYIDLNLCGYFHLDSYMFKFDNFLLTFLTPHPLPLPTGERGRVRGLGLANGLGFSDYI